MTIENVGATLVVPLAAVGVGTAVTAYRQRISWTHMSRRASRAPVVRVGQST
jgi:hypothetical protein